VKFSSPRRACRLEGALRLGNFHSALVLHGLLEQPALGSECRCRHGARPVVVPGRWCQPDSEWEPEAAG
jgi:hypothetical protein